MKTNTYLFPVLILSLLSLQSCQKKNLWGITGKGGNITETRQVTGFDKISLRTDADVEFTQDSTYFIEVSGQKNILAVLETRNESGTLVIDYTKNVWKHTTVRVTVHAPALYCLKISGSGDVHAKNNLSTSNLELAISGSGDMVLEGLNASTLDAKISGSGSMSIYSGTVSSEKMSISGSGNMSFSGLTASGSTCKISGSGDMKVNATENLDVSISGSGDVRYLGNPHIHSSISGSGTLKQL